DYDAFILKLNAAGNFVLAKRIGGAGQDEIYGITADAEGNVYSVGTYIPPVDFNPGPGTFNLSGSNAFIVKLDANGNFVWAQRITDNGGVFSVTCIAVD